MHAETLLGQARTNNTCEGWHRSVQYLIGSHRPTLWKFIESLRSMQRKQEFTLSQRLSGSQPPPRKRKYRDYDIKLYNVVSEYHNMPILDYMMNVASNIKYSV